MKKILVILLMICVACFASPLFALDGSPPGVKTFNSTNSGEMICDKNGLGLVGAAHADDVTFVKVDILPLDTLMYSWGEGIDTKITKWTEGQNANMNLALATLAVVRYPRGVVGCDALI